MSNDSLKKQEKVLATPEATLSFGALLASKLTPPCIFYLVGDLGAGKTTLVRGMLRALGYDGSVRSPTFTLLEPYEDLPFPLYHFDLYRLKNETELENVGFWDYYQTGGIIIVEWPDAFSAVLPEPDVICQLMQQGNGRVVILTGGSERGNAYIQQVLQG